MKKVILGILTIAITIVLTSCSTNETADLISAENQSLLKTYTLQKDVNGYYSVDYTTTSTTGIETSFNGATKEIYLFSESANKKTKHTEALAIENNKLSVDFIEKSKIKTSFIVEDDNIILAKGEKNNNFLRTFTLKKNIDGTYQLNFKVRLGINTSFIYNEQERIYEINLKEGNTTQSNFSKVFVKEAGNPLRIDFINHLNNNQARGEESSSRPRRPRVIIVD